MFPCIYLKIKYKTAFKVMPINSRMVLLLKLMTTFMWQKYKKNYLRSCTQFKDDFTS